MKRNILLLLLAFSLVSVMSCNKDGLTDARDVMTDEIPAATTPLVPVSFTATLPSEEDTKVIYAPSSNILALSWESGEEKIGVYLKHGDAIQYAGFLTGTGYSGKEKTFSGSINAKEDDSDKYIYVYPYLDNGSGINTIDWTTQDGQLEHLKNKIPLVWKETSDGYALSISAYVIKLTFSFASNVTDISSVLIRTMDRGSITAGPDKVFPKKFSVSGLLNSGANNALPSSNDGLALSSDVFTNQITLNYATPPTLVSDGYGAYVLDAYLVCGSVSNLNVYSSKFRAEVVTGSTRYYSDIRSFPGQANAAGQTLAIFDEGKVYRMSRTMSQVPPLTSISSAFNLGSLMGMWNKFGKPYDPDGLIYKDGGNYSLPAALGTMSDASSNLYKIVKLYTDNVNSTNKNLNSAYVTALTNGYNQQKTALSDDQRDRTVNDITLASDSEVYVSFVSEFAWNQNMLGYYYYNGGSVPSHPNDVNKYVLFPNVSKPSHEPFAKEIRNNANNRGNSSDAPLAHGETVRLVYTDAQGYSSYTFPAGTVIGFIMMIDGSFNDQVGDADPVINGTLGEYTLFKWDQWKLYTDTAWNAAYIPNVTPLKYANSNWTGDTYPALANFFLSADVCPGLAFYGVKDNMTSSTPSSMLYLVSTSVPEAMKTGTTQVFSPTDGTFTTGSTINK